MTIRPLDGQDLARAVRQDIQGPLPLGRVSRL